MTPADSTSPTVRRHASAFRRTWPEPDPIPVVTHPRRPDAQPVDLVDLDHAAVLLADAPTAVRTAARNAVAGRWTWTAHYGHGRVPGRPEVESESLVLRASRDRSLPWRVHRVVAVWRRSGGSGAWGFEAAWRWALDGPTVTEPP